MLDATARPDPDALLADLKKREQREGRGRLRIYFGGSAGVGKTYAMLLAGRSLKEAGQDVVIGFIESHDRAETLAVLESANLPSLPLKNIEINGRILTEFDLDAALVRHPQLILVDELAHTNLPGSRHPKRWQDVEELLAAGIDVFTALNVQHLESLRDVVQGITGVRVAETVPDTFFDTASEVILVDLPTDELLKRLQSGRVYEMEQADRAAKNFFRSGNLLALRELALRRTAERVESDVQSYRVEKAISEVWKTKASLLCCIGPNAGDELLVRSAARLAAELDVGWHAVYVETPKLQRLAPAARDRVLGAVNLAGTLGAKTAILSGDDAARVIIDYARAQNLSRVVVGRQMNRHWPWQISVAQSIAKNAPDVDLIDMATARGASPAQEHALDTGARFEHKVINTRNAHFAAAFASVLTTAIALPLFPYLHVTNTAMLFVMTVALVAMRYGRNPAVLAAFLNVASYDFFFVPPRFSFAVDNYQDLVTFVVMLSVGVMIAELTARLRYQVRVAAHREERARSLYEFARELSAALRADDVESISTRTIEGTFRAEAIVIEARAGDRLAIPDVLNQRQDFEPAIAAWAFDHRLPAGLGTDTLPKSSFLYLPLVAPTRVRGVLAVKPRARRYLMVPEQARQLRTFAALIGIALERVHYVEVAQSAVISIESEKLRNSLLSALSHDLRTPLAAVVGLAESLASSSPPIRDEQLALARGIVDQAHRMSALLTNLLDMARIASGDTHLNCQWQPLGEVVGSALGSLRLQLQGHQVGVFLEDAEELVYIDAVLIERVLSNLIENAIKYTPPSSTITIRSLHHGSQLHVVVEDDGPGLPPGDAERLFEKFVRGHPESAVNGIGLGLAISRALVRAHGGDLTADTHVAKGARFVIALPLKVVPREISEEAKIDAHV
jgi:two-component system sensor histidine kinase KdpD